ncbi:WYL domain-containing protein [Shewanella sp. A25]|nr:WYL domain-containing protein [Shewanella shenzhenensis]
MSSASAANTLYRQWYLLRQIPSFGDGISNEELKLRLADEGIEVSIRTVQRDLESICLRFPIYSTAETKPMRWRWMENRQVDIQGTGINEALSLLLVESTMEHLLPASVSKSLKNKFINAKQVLEAAKSQSHIASWFDKVASISPTLQQIPPAIDDSVLEFVQQALLKDQTIEIHYQAGNRTMSNTYLLMPLALIQRGLVLYLIGQVSGETQIKMFAMHRVKGVTHKVVDMQRPATFELNQYLASGAMEFSNGEQLSLVAKVDKSLAHHLTETPLSADMQLTELNDTHSILTATVYDGWQLQWWLQSNLNQLEVVSPPSLRESMKSKLAAALAQYQ